MSEQLTIPDPDSRIRVPLNHVQRAGDDVVMRLVVGAQTAPIAIWVALEPGEARDLAERLVRAADDEASA